MIEEAYFDEAECKECGQPLLWGGMAWVQHSERQHQVHRRILMTVALQLLQGKFAMQVGHKVRIRFAGKTAWAECRCFWNGTVYNDTTPARAEGRQHLADRGLALMLMLRPMKRALDKTAEEARK